MSFIQRIVKTILPRNWGESIETESREWMISCPCGYSRSIWDIGGIRWKAKGVRTVFMMCRQCRERTMHKISRDGVGEVQ